MGIVVFKRNETSGFKCRIFPYVQQGLVAAIHIVTQWLIIMISTFKNRFLLGNYLKSGFRNIQRSFLFSGINITGLSLSMSIGLLLISGATYINNFDQFHENKHRIYRVITHLNDEYFGNRSYATTSIALVQELFEHYDGIERIVRLNSSFGGDATNRIKTVPINGYFAGEEFFNMFSFEMMDGSPSTALKQPFSIVLTREAALKLFNKVSVIGEAIEIDEMGTFQITGIIEKPPANSHFQFESLASYATIEALAAQGRSHANHADFDNLNNGYVYLQLQKGAFTDKIQSLLEGFGDRVSNQYPKKNYSYELQPLTAIIPGKALLNQIGPQMETLVIVIFSFLVGIIILSTCFNYTNLSFARALNRTKEIAVRKTMGGSKFQIFTQFIIESVLLSILALLAALVIAYFIKPHIYSIDAGIKEMFSMELRLDAALYFVAFAFTVGILAGLLPALILANQKAIKLFGEKYDYNFLRFLNLRKILIIFQFTLSLVCTIAAIIIIKQFTFSVSFDMGFERDDIVNVRLQGTDPQLLSDELAKVPEVRSVSMSSGLLGVGARSRYWLIPDQFQDSTLVDFMSASPEFLNTLEIPLLAGRNFNDYDYRSPENPILINEQFIHEFRLESPANAIGKIIRGTNNKRFQIIGVTENFNYDRLREPIGSFFFVNRPQSYAFANVKVHSSDRKSAMNSIETAWTKVDDVHKFSGEYYNERVKEALGFYLVATKVLAFTALLTVCIACMGLLGIVIYTSRSRIREIAIRKVLGADEKGLVYLLSKNFIRMMIWATVISVSLTYLLFNKLVLPREAFSVTAEFWDFATGVCIIITLGLVVIVTQTLKVARSNPIASIQSD